VDTVHQRESLISSLKAMGRKAVKIDGKFVSLSLCCTEVLERELERMCWKESMPKIN
jgi:hypothetical protein